ncbi:MAG: beta-ketoacyl-ACP reductase [Thermoplasmata archaeon]|nr:beta-ketoacyl-ACP reductase [Thermoplasmata archaeon]
MRLNDKVAIVTGGGSGIGESTVLRFVDEGAKVAIVDVVPEGANKVAQAVKEKGGEALVSIANICKKGDVDKMVAATLDKFGKVDILINNAGINRDSIAKKMTEEQWDEVMDVNLKGTFLCSQAAAVPMMEQNYGRIVNTASIGALGNIGQANYAASKAGVMGLTKTLALELARYNITVNCVSPGATKTPMTATMPPEFAEKLTKKIPLRRFAEAEELANAHLFLASEESSYITGQIIFVDGGISLGF